MRNKLNLLFVAFCIFSSKAKSQDKELIRLANWLQGSYSSELQAKKDSDFFDIRLHISRIWQDKKDGFWFYVEQAVASSQEKPYRQRVYHLTQLSDSKFESAVFTLPKPLRFAGDWKKENALAQMTPDSLEKRKGCSVFLSKISNRLACFGFDLADIDLTFAKSQA